MERENVREKKPKSWLGERIAHYGGFWNKGRIDYGFLIVLLIIVAVGLVMLYSASYVYAYYEEGDPTHFFKKQLLITGLGLALMTLFSFINYRIFFRIAAVLGTIGSFGLLLIARFFMKAHNETWRYIYLGPIQFQPSDIAKFMLIMTLAYILTRHHEEIVSKKELPQPRLKQINRQLKHPVFNISVPWVIGCFLLIAAYCGLVMLGKHLSGTILLFLIGIILMFLGEVRKKWFAAVAAGLPLVFLILMKLNVFAEYMTTRWVAFIDKEYDPSNARWQVNQALYAIGSGGLFGKGFGQSTLKHMYVPEPQNDMIFSIVVEELGLLGAGIILVLFALLIWRGVVIGINSPDRYGALIAMGVSFQLALNVIFNILVATDSVPNTGILLPFFSQGGTASLVLLVEMGVVLSISRGSRIRRS